MNNVNNVLKKMTEKQLKHADEWICWVFYQPKMPKGIERIIKKSK